MRLHLAQGHRRHRIGAPFVGGKNKREKREERERDAHLGTTEPIGDLTAVFLFLLSLPRIPPSSRRHLALPFLPNARVHTRAHIASIVRTSDVN